MRRTQRSCLLLPQNPKNPLPNGLSLLPEPRHLFPHSHLVIEIEPRHLLPQLRNQIQHGTMTSSSSMISTITHNLLNAHLSHPPL